MNKQPGQQVGDFQLLRLLERSDLMDSYQGEHTRTAMTVTLNVFRRRVTAEQEALFLREAQRIARLSHPHIARVLDFDVYEGQPFLALEYIPASLRQMYPAGAQLPLSVVMEYVKQVGSALQYAHQQGIVHGDLRPEQMALREQDRCLLLGGLGLVSIVYSLGSTIMNTSPYMAPEQRQRAPQQASDQYALACIIYEWLSGTGPGSGASNISLPGLPLMVEPVLRMALAVEPGHRFSNIQTFVMSLEQANASMPPLQPVQPLPGSNEPTAIAATVITPGPQDQGTPVYPSREPVTQVSSASQIPPLPTTLEQAYAHPPVAGALQVDRSQVQSTTKVGGVSRRTLLIGAGVGTVGLLGLGIGGTVLLKSLAHSASTPLPPTLVSTYSDNQVSSLDIIRWSPDSTRVLIVSYFDGFYLLDALTGKLLLNGSPRDQQATVWSVGWVQNKLYIAWIGKTPDERTVHIMEAVTKKAGATYALPLSGDLLWSPAGSRIASIGLDSSGPYTVVNIWNPLTAQSIVQFRVPVEGDSNNSNNVVNSFQQGAQWSPDEKRLLTWGYNGILHVWDAQSGQQIASYRKHFDDHAHESSNMTVFLSDDSITWSPDGQWITSNANVKNDLAIHVWNAATGAATTIYNGHVGETRIIKLAWSSDSKMIASIGDSGLTHVWQATTGTQLFVHKDSLYSGLAWKPGNARIASSGEDSTDQTISFLAWDAKNGANVVDYGNVSGPGTPTPTPDLSFNATRYNGAEMIVYSPNGQYIAAVDNRILYVWTGGW